MLNDVSSRHLRNASELLVRVPIKQGFVPISDMTLSYASRLRILLQALYELRRVMAESAVRWNHGPIEDLESIFNSQWTVLEDDRELLVTVSFDHSFEEYFQKLVRFGGPSLDLIFCHCEGYTDAACMDAHGVPRYQAFPEFVRRHQLACDFYYAGAPDLTVDDLTYLRRLAIEPRPSIRAAAELHTGPARDELDELERLSTYPRALEAVRQANPRLTPSQAPAAVAKLLGSEQAKGLRKVLAALHDLRRFFPECSEPDPASTAIAPEARAIFDAGVYNLVPQLAQLALPPAPSNELEQWIGELQRRGRPTLNPEPSVTLGKAELDAIQGNILTSYQGMTHGALVLLRCRSPERAGAFLKAFVDRLTSQSASEGDGPFANLALTYPGLRRLGLASDVLGWFPKEFREGMEQRAFAVGDIGEPNHPDYWQLPTANWRARDQPLVNDADAPRIALASVDFIVTFQTRSQAGHDWPEHPLHASVASLEALGADVLHVQLLRRAPTQPVIEHFGFADGGSQPVPDAQWPAKPSGPRAATRDLQPLGELLLGYRDDRGETAFCADPRHNASSAALFAQGSFVVFRKLEQDVAAFDEFAEANAANLSPAAATQVKEWTLGRFLDSGKPLAAPKATDNDFDYSDDPTGSACPLHAHVRRANPRVTDANGRGALPRIMRRGFSYGPRYGEAPDAERGLMFMAYNASIAGQYEVIQRWVNGGNITGILSSQNDLFTGSPQAIGAPHWVRAGDWKELNPPAHPFVSLRWGLYAFAPSRTAVSWLATYALARPLVPERDPELARRGQSMIEALELLERTQGPDAARIGWKNAIEEPMNPGRSAALWAAIRARGGVLETPYALLVGHKLGAQEVLAGDGRRFSVREYWHRLHGTTGEHYLAFDPAPAHLGSSDPTEQQKHAEYEARLGPGGTSYTRAGSDPNRFILDNFNASGAFSAQRVHAAARDLAKATLERTIDPATGRGEIALEALAVLVVARLCRTWFGMPNVPAGSANEDAKLAAQLQPFVLASKFSFQPYPEPALTDAATRAGAALKAQTTGQSVFESVLAQADYGDPEDIRRVMVGSIVGFAAPAIGCVIAVFNQWLERGEIGRLVVAWRAEPKPALLEDELKQALLLTPIPPLLYRTAMPGAALGGRTLSPGQLVVVGLGSAAIDAEDWNWLFGGTRDVNPHACPARGAALAAVTGIAAAILERKDMRRERPLVVSFA